MFRNLLFLGSLALFLGQGSATAAEHPSCRLSPELRQKLMTLDPENLSCNTTGKCYAEALEASRRLLAENPGQLWAARLVQMYEERVAARDPEKNQQLREIYEKAAAAAPNDVTAQILLGRKQFAAREEVAAIHKALALDPGQPLARLILAFVENQQEAPDAEKIRQHLTAFVESCPAFDFEALKLMPFWTEAAFWSPVLAKMRAGIPSRPGLEQAMVLDRIWRSEFQLLPPAEHAAARARVSAELATIEGLPLEKEPAFWEALKRGYELAGKDPAVLARRRALTFPCDDEVIEMARRDLRTGLGLPTEPGPTKETASDEQRRGFEAGLRELLGRCPGNLKLSMDLFFLLAEAPPGEVDTRLVAAAEGLSAAWVGSRGHVFSARPITIEVAQRLIDRRLAPAKALEILKEARIDFEAVVNRMRPPGPVPADVEARQKAGRTTVDAELSTLEARARLQLGETAAAKEKLEAAHKLYASLATPPVLKVLSAYDEARKELIAAGVEAPPEVQPGSAPESTLLKDMNEDFAGLPMPDPQGKMWAATDLQGKVWLVNLWATWCGPCMAELPHVQKLHEELKDNPEMGVLTLNFDFESGKVQPFLERKAYTFPVLMAGEALKHVTKEGIPQNWLLDGNLKVRGKVTGFDAGNPEKFLEEVRQGLAKLKAK